MGSVTGGRPTDQVDMAGAVEIGVARRDITPPVGIYARQWGAAQHDVYPDLINTRPLAREDGNGVTFFGIEEPIGLGDEIEVMSAQRIAAQEAYREFHRFASKLHNEMPAAMS